MRPLSYDPDLVASIEARQRDYLLAGGFDLEAFAKRTDLVEFHPARRMFMRLVAVSCRLTGRRALADNIDALLDYMSGMAPRAAELPARQAAVEALFAGPVTRYQRRDDHYLLCSIREMIKSSLVEESAGDSWRDFCAASDRTLLATAPIGRCNAVIESNENGDQFAMLMDDEMGRLAAQIGAVFAGLVRDDGGAVVPGASSAAGDLGAGSRIVRSYGSMTTAFVERGSTLLAAPVSPRTDFEFNAAGAFASVAMAWVISHELAHAHLRHMSQSVLLRELQDGDEKEERAEMIFAMEAEFEADAFAKRVARGVCAHYRCDPWVAGAAAAGLLAVYSSAYGAIAANVVGDASEEERDEIIRRVFRHPTPDERLARLLSPDDPAEAWAMNVIDRLRESARYRSIARIHPRWSKLTRALTRLETGSRRA